MSRLPRILPLAAVAVAGVLAINLMAGARDFPSLISGARAWAEDIAPKGKASSKAASKAATKGPEVATATLPSILPSLSPLPPPPGQTPAGTATSTAAICAPSAAELAQRAQMSPAELQNLQSLRERSSQIDAREKGLDTQVAALDAAGVKLDGKIAAMQDLVKQVQALLGQADTQQQAQNSRLVAVYENMAGASAGQKAAADQLIAMSDEVRLPIMAAMNPRKLTLVMQKMPADKAAQLTEKLAQRMQNALALNQAKAAIAANTAPSAAPKAGAIPPGRSGGAAPATASGAQPKAAPTAAPTATPAPTAAGAQPKAAPTTAAPAPARGGTTPASTGTPGRGAGQPVANAAPTAPAQTTPLPPVGPKAAPKTG